MTCLWKPFPSVLVLALLSSAALPGRPASASGAAADGWPTYGHDNRRSSISTEKLGPTLSEDWVFTPRHPARHAWGDPQPKPVEGKLELPRLRFDDAFHVVAVGDRAYFGSSADNKVYALDARDGQVCWEFYTEGPVRLAPTVWDRKVHVGSDDGLVYCLAADDGRIVWKFSAAPGRQKVLGNGKMISVWPVRTGVLVDNGVAYFGAGVFPFEGLYLYAVDAEDGRLLWRNDTYGGGGHGSISPQGYMLATEDKLFVPSSRAMPAVFSREDGRLLFHRNFSRWVVGLFGGTYCSLAGDLLFNGTELRVLGARQDNGEFVFAEAARRLIATQDSVYFLTGKEAIAVERKVWRLKQSQQTVLDQLKREHATLKRQAEKDASVQKRVEGLGRQIGEAAARHKELEEQARAATRWRVPCACAESMALTPDVLFVGGPDVVKGLDTATGKEVWSAEVNGKARGLAIANGRLFVSTAKAIHCFLTGNEGRGRKLTPQIMTDPFPKGQSAPPYAGAADTIVADSGVRKGHALILGQPGGQLALELARRTDLVVTTVGQDETAVAAARRALSAVGLYGERVSVAQTAPSDVPFADHFANLIVCEVGTLSGPAPVQPGEILRMLKPCGGVAYLGVPSSPAPRAWGARRRLRRWVGAFKEELADLGDDSSEVKMRGKWARITRGALPGAGSWSHQYANTGNTACSGDQLVRGGLGLLWYGEPGPGRMPSRHAAAAAPLSTGGRMFVEGENVIMAYDAYNGVKLWERDIPGAMRLRLSSGRCSNLAASEDSLFVVAKGTCHRLDARTGKTLRTYRGPAASDGKPAAWDDYVACSDDVVYGTRGDDCLFALGVGDGQLRWAYNGKSIGLNTICIDDGTVFLVDRSLPAEEREQCLGNISAELRLDRRGDPVEPDVRRVVAIDAKTGTTKWAKAQYVSDCVKIGPRGGALIAMVANHVLLLCAQPWNGHFWTEFLAGEFSRRSLIALDARDGRTLWSGRKGYRSRPLIVDGWIIAEPWAYDLKTGAARMRKHPVTGAETAWQMSRPGFHCGSISAAPKAMFFRSGTTGYYDLAGDYGTANFGAQRPGCWINCIPANGVVMMPEASSGCICPFPLHCTTVLHPRKTNRMWGLFSAAGKMTPVKHLAINFGAPGDRRDANGRLWLAYPRPQSDRRTMVWLAYPEPGRDWLALELKLEAQILDGGGFFRHNADSPETDGADSAWMYSSGCKGLAKCRIPLAEDDRTEHTYTVRLHFAVTADDPPGRRVFDIKLQGRTVVTDFDIHREAGEHKVLRKEFTGVRATQALTVEFVPKAQRVSDATLPTINGIEVLRQGE